MATDTQDDVDVTVMAFAQWLSENRSRTQGNIQQLLAEMGIMRNGITANNSDLMEFKRHMAQVQQQQQREISELRDKLTEAHSEISTLKKEKKQTDQEMAADYQSLAEQLNFKHVEIETLKKAYSQTHQQLQQQIIGLQTDLNEVRLSREETHRMATNTNEQMMNKTSELNMSTEWATTELKRVRVDHDQAIANLAENMNKWNDTIRDLSREFHEFQKLMTSNQQRLQVSLEGMQTSITSVPAPTPTQHPQASMAQQQHNQAIQQQHVMQQQAVRQASTGSGAPRWSADYYTGMQRPQMLNMGGMGR